MRNIKTIFILVLSLILLFAVSCSNDDKTGVKNNPPENDAGVQFENIELNKSSEILPLYNINEEIIKESEIEKEIKDLNINEITPIDAINLISKWKRDL